MKTVWDYTNLTKAYLKRPDHAKSSISGMHNKADVEPNDAMRANGIKTTQAYRIKRGKHKKTPYTARILMAQKIKMKGIKNA